MEKSEVNSPSTSWKQACNRANVPSSTELMEELGKFIRGTSGSQIVSHRELSPCALRLLHTLPVAQPAVLHYLCNLFDEATNNNLAATEPGADRMGGDSSSLDDVIEETCTVLLDIIHTNPGPWAPVISSWSFDLLGHISIKYAPRLRMPQCPSLNQILQVWMTIPSTKQLIHIAMDCFAAMVTANPDICVDSLLEASVKYTPYFDWVVAHIGSCFPTTIITRVLMSGLKDFCIHSNGMDVSAATSDDKSSKMSSVVGILGHLASKHGQDIRKALIHLFKESLEPEEDHMKMSTVTFLLQMASMSPLLLHIITTDFITILTPEVLNTLHDQFYRWSSDNSDFFSLLSLVVHLVMKCEGGAYRLFHFLLDVAAPADERYATCKDAVKSTAVTLLDQLCVDLQRAAYNRRNAIEIPFLSSLSKHTHDVTKLLLQSEGRRSSWTSEMLTYTALYFGEVCAADVLCHVLMEASTPQQLQHFTTLQKQLEVGYEGVFDQCVTRFMDTLNSQPPTAHYQMLTNLLSLVLVAQESGASESKENAPTPTLRHHIAGFTTLLVHSDHRVTMTTARLIHTIGLDNKCPSDVILDLCNALCLMLFNIFTVKEYRQSSEAFRWCKKCIIDLCQFNTARNVLLRLLLEVALLTDFAETLGGRYKPTTNNTTITNNNNDISLLKENRKHGLSLTLPQSHSCVFHAGIIGDGKRVTEDKHKVPEDIILRNRMYFIDILLLCTTIPKPTDPISDPSDASDPRIDPYFYTNESGRKLAEILVDMLTPDVLYNSILWPEEECIPLTIESLWTLCPYHTDFGWTTVSSAGTHVMSMVDHVTDGYEVDQAFVCYLSPVLRSLMATVINHFDSSRHIRPATSGEYVTRGRRIINCLHKGKQLPPPLCHIGEILPHIPQYQISLLLTNVWKYVKENPPKIDNTGKRNVCEPRYSAVVHSVLHNNINTLGVFFSQFFTAPPVTS